MAYYENLADVCTYLQTLITANQTALGLTAVVMGADTSVMPSPPAAILIPGEERWTLEATEMQAAVDFSVSIFVIHGDVTQTRGARSYADMHLASSVRDVIRHDWTLGSNVVACWVAGMIPRRVPSPKQAWLLGTVLNVVAVSRSVARL